jgi:hypothetical protein
LSTEQGEELVCVFCDRAKRMCAGYRACQPAQLETAKINAGDWKKKEEERIARATTQPADVVNTKRPSGPDGTLL